MTDDAILAQFHSDIVAASVDARRRFKVYNMSWFRIDQPYVIRDGWRRVASFADKATAEARLDELWRATAIRDALTRLASRKIEGSTLRLTETLTRYLLSKA